MIPLRRLAIAGAAVVAIVSMAVSSAAADLPADWRNWSHFRDVESDGSDALVSISLPDDLWKHARTDLADLRLVGTDGVEIGYVLYSSGEEHTSRWRRAETLDRGAVPGRYAQVVIDVGEDGSIHNAIEVTLNAGEGEVFTWTEVAASDDRDTWRVVRPRAPLYRFADDGLGGPVSIRYPRTRDRWLRLRLLEEGATLEVAAVRVGERSGAGTQYREVGRSMVRRSLVDSRGPTSVWETPGSLSRMPIAGVRVETARESFHRPLVVSTSEDAKSWTDIGGGVVYRYADSDGDSPTRLEQLDVAIRDAAAPHWRVRVVNRGDPPIEDLRVRLLRKERKIAFRAAGPGPIRVVYGNHLAEPPEYELARLVSADELSAASAVTLGREQDNESYLSPEPFTERHPVLMWAALLLAVLVVGGLAIKSLR